MPGTNKHGWAECHIRLPTQHSKVTLKVSFLKSQFVFIHLLTISVIVKFCYLLLLAVKWQLKTIESLICDTCVDKIDFFYALDILNNIQISKMYVLSTFKEHKEWDLQTVQLEKTYRNKFHRKNLLFR